MNTSIQEQMKNFFNEKVANSFSEYSIELLDNLAQHLPNNPTKNDYKDIIKSHDGLILFINNLQPEAKEIMEKYTTISTSHYRKMMVPALMFLSTE